MAASQDQRKYGNPLKRFFIDRLMRHLVADLAAMRAHTILDLGCGDGYFIAYLSQQMNAAVTGVDMNAAKLEQARLKSPQHTFICADLYSLDLAGPQPDLVLAMEVLEHLSAPEQALQRMAQLAPISVITVPFEPWFSILSFAGGSYMRTFGRHPEHVHAWTPATFLALTSQFYHSVKIEISFPWIIALCSMPAV